MKNLYLLLALSCTGCGGVMDYLSRPIDVHGTLVSTNPASEIILAVPNTLHTPSECAELIRKDAAAECVAKKVTLNLAGEFEATFPSSMRGCPYLLVPPLLDLLCDRKSYLLVSVPSLTGDIYLVTVSSRGKSTISRFEEDKGPASSELYVVSAAQIPVKDAGSEKDNKDVITLRVTQK